MSSKNYYQILEVAKDASDAEIKKSFRSLAKKYHPDRNPGDKAAEAKFKEINEAYDVLKDPEKRATYDRYGDSAFQGGGGNGPGGGFYAEGFDDISNIFGSMFGDFMGAGRRADPSFINRGSDLRYDLEISLEEAYKGGKHQIKFKSNTKCKSCNGSGSKSGKLSTCGTCNGSGKVRAQQGFFIVERTCSRCEGRGQIVQDPCGGCGGSGVNLENKVLNVNVPAGVEDGVRLRINNEGEAGRNGGKSGDLYVFINVRKHQLFTRHGHDLHCTVPISITTAALGGNIEVPCLDGNNAKVAIAEGTQNGAQFRLRGKGMPIPAASRVGDMIIQVKVEVPVNLSKKQKELLRAFEEGSNAACNPESQNFFGKVKSFFDELKGGDGK